MEKRNVSNEWRLILTQSMENGKLKMVISWPDDLACVGPSRVLPTTFKVKTWHSLNLESIGTNSGQ